MEHGPYSLTQEVARGYQLLKSEHRVDFLVQPKFCL